MREKQSESGESSQVVTKERPNFGDNQVKRVSEIEMGKRYRKHHYSGTGEILIPIRKSYRTGWIKAKLIFDQEPITDKDIEIASIRDIPLADCGVIPYEKTGMWNKTNWLEKPKEKTNGERR